MKASFEPIFIVGCERSGTTLLASFLDRHSQVAVPPETFFFSDVVHQAFWPRLSWSHESLLRAALAGRVGEFALDEKALLADFKTRPPSLPDLFRCILEAYARRAGKQRAGEKTVLHIFYVPLLMRWFPKAKFLGITRDGRDVVRSMMNAPWHPDKLQLKCANWRHKMRLLMKWQARYPKNFRTVRYEDLLLDTPRVLREIDAFLGLPFEAGQADPALKTGVYLQREKSYKSKVQETVDASRAFAWKRDLPEPTRWAMSAMMEPTLRDLGYQVGDLSGCPAGKKTLYLALKAFWVPAFWLAVRFNGLIAYDKIRYLWHRRLRRRSGNAMQEGLQP
jgi:hypothetical protein